MKTLTLQNDAQALLKPTFTDMLGAPIAGPAGGTASSSDETLFSASVNGDGNVVVIATQGAIGTGTLNYTNGRLIDSASVVVAAPAAYSVELDVADAAISAKPATPAPATPVASSAA